MLLTRRRRRSALLVSCLAAAALAAACDGSNGWTPTGPAGGNNNGGGSGNTAADTVSPVVTLVKPDSNANVAVGDSLFVQAHVSDNTALDSVTFRGVQLIGSEDLGTATGVARFVTKTVNLKGLSPAVKDTTLKRFLLPTADSSRVQGIFVVVTAWDTAGNASSAVTRVNIGGPRVQVSVQNAAQGFAVGGQFLVQVTAVDSSQLVHTVRLLGSGAFAFDTTLTFVPSVPSVSQTVTVLIPGSSGTGTETVQGVVTASSGAQGVSSPVSFTIRASGQDVTAPQVSFTANVPAKMEVDDSFSVALQGADETRIDSLGVTVLAIHPRAGGEDTLRVFTSRRQVTSDSVNFSLLQVPANLLTGLDTLHLRVEVTAWAKDPAGNCATAVSPGTPQRNACVVKSGVRYAPTAGYIFPVLVVRGTTVAPPNDGDVLADLVADSQRVYLSNYSRNELEVLPLGGTVYAPPVRVGSQPWGLAIGRFRDSLYVANSGGTNISVIPLGSGPLQEAQGQRIFTRNEKLFSVQFSPSSLEPGEVTVFDYSDRPQFLAQASNGLLVYSTKPTPADTNGTVRIYDPRKLRSEIFTGYVDRHTSGQAIVVNADSAFLVAGSPKQVMVCPRRRFGDATDPGFCVTGNVLFVSDSLTSMRMQPANAAGGKWDTRLDIGANIAEVGFSDTTFVAVSGDRNYVAVGEGARQNARIPMFNAPANGDSLVLVGDVSDLISNAAERVIGLGLNWDGSLGVARGNQAYYFNQSLRLQGVVAAGSPAGGVAMHPSNANYPSGGNRFSFVSGIDAIGGYVDVIDNFNFFRVKRLYTRDPVVGAMAVAPRAGADSPDVVLRVYALTTRGVLSLAVTTADMTP